MQSSDKFITRASSIIILITSLAIISFMSYGGCGGGGGNNGDGGTDPSSTPVPTATFTPPTPTPTTPPGATGGPGCGSVQVSLGCPAVSLEESMCIGHICEVIDESGPEPVVLDEFIIRFGEKCTAFDCFTLECQNTSQSIGDSVIVIETVSGKPVSEGDESVEYNGMPRGPIFIGEDEFILDCNSLVVP